MRDSPSQNECVSIIGGIVLVVALSSAGVNPACADDLELMQGVWVSRDWPVVVEFRESTAIFRGVDPFAYKGPSIDEPLPEFKVRFTLDPKQSPKGFTLNEEDFAGYRELRARSYSQLTKGSATPPGGIYEIGVLPDGSSPSAMKLEFYPRGRSWETKGFNDQSFGSEDRPSRILHRLSAEELATYQKLSGVWQGELRRDDKVVHRGVWAITPGWLISDHGHFGHWPLSLENNGRFRFQQTVLQEDSPIPQVKRKSGGLAIFGSPSRRITLNWSGTYQFSGDDRLKVELYPFPKSFLTLYGGVIVVLDNIEEYLLQLDAANEANESSDKLDAAKLAILKSELKDQFKDFDAYVKSEEFIKETNAIEQLDAFKSENKAVVEERKRLTIEGREATLVVASLTRVEQPAGVDPLLGLLQAKHPEWPSEQFLNGSWKVVEQVRYEIELVGRNRTTKFVPVPVAELVTWQFEPDKVSVTTPAGKKSYLGLYQVKGGVLRLKHQGNDIRTTGYLTAKIVDNALELQGSINDHPDYKGTWRYKMERTFPQQE